MTRRIAASRPLWDTLLALSLVFVVVDVVTALAPGLPGLDLPGGFLPVAAVIGAVLVLMLLIGVSPTADVEGPVELAPPVWGRWVAMNSPGQQVPSHGTRTRGQLCAIDVCSPSNEESPALVRWAWRSSRPEEYESFGEPVRAMAAGTVVRLRSNRRDHRARNTWQALAFMMTLEGLLREMAGSPHVLGNHVVIDHGDGTFAAYAHLRHRSVEAVQGCRVEVGEVLGQVGNTGNTSMPHLHAQLMDRADVDAAAGVAMTWSGLVGTGEIDGQLATFAKDPAGSALAGMPRNGEVFVVGPSGA